MNRAIEVMDLRSGESVNASAMFTGSFSAAPEYRMFSSRSVVVATLLGTPAAGAVLMAVNYLRLGKTGFAAATVAVGLAVSAVAIELGYALPRQSASLIALTWLILTGLAAALMQGKAVARHVNAGGRLASGWVGLGVGLVFLCVTFAVVFGVVRSRTVRNKVTIGEKDEVFYTGLATARDARALGEALKANGYLADRGTSVFLDGDKRGATIALVVKEGAWNDPDLLAREEEVVREVASSVGGLPIRVKVIDAQQEVKMQGVVGRASVDGKDEVFYFGRATLAEATALDRELQDEAYFTGRGTSVLLSKDDAGTVLSFVVAEGSWDDTQRVDAFETMARKMAPVVGGLPLTLRLVNTALETRKEVALQ
jgi:hypothetical protein